MAKRQILVVGNTLTDARGIESCLKDLGYTVPAIALSKEEVIQHVADTQTDLVLMDINLEKEMGGIEVAEQIRASFDIPVVYLTTDETLQRTKITEPFSYLLKPFSKKEPCSLRLSRENEWLRKNGNR